VSKAKEGSAKYSQSMQMQMQPAVESVNEPNKKRPCGSEPCRAAPITALNIPLEDYFDWYPDCYLKGELRAAVNKDPTAVRDVSFHPPRDAHGHIGCADLEGYDDAVLGIGDIFSKSTIRQKPKIPDDLRDDYTHFYFTTFPSLRFPNGIPPETHLKVLRRIVATDKRDFSGIWTLPQIMITKMESVEYEVWRKYLEVNSLSGDNPKVGRMKTSQAMLLTLVVRIPVAKAILDRQFGDLPVCFMSFPSLPFPLTSNVRDEANIFSDPPTCTVKLVPLESYSIEHRRAMIKMYDGTDLMGLEQVTRMEDLSPEMGDESIASVEMNSSLGKITEELEGCGLANPIPKHFRSPAIRLFNFFDQGFIPPSWGGRDLIREHKEGHLPSIDEIRAGTASGLRCQGDEKMVRSLSQVYSSYLSGMPGNALLVGFVRLDRDWLTQHIANKPAEVEGGVTRKRDRETFEADDVLQLKA
jgi:hypothetical protein